MALLCHFPLDGRLNNLVEGSNITLTNNGAVINNHGKLGNCYVFDGTDDYMVTNSGVFDNVNTKNFSMCCWVKPISLKRYGGIITLHGGSDKGTGLILYDNNVFAVQRTMNSGTWTYTVVPTSSSFNLNSWYHVSYICENETVKIYMNGELKVSKKESDTVQSFNNCRLAIGCDMPGGDEYGNVAINDVRIYDHALSDAEVVGLTATRKLLNSDGVERIGKNIKKEMEKRGNVKDNQIASNTLFAIDYRKSLIAWSKYGNIKPEKYDSIKYFDDNIFKYLGDGNAILGGNRNNEKGLYHGRGVENLAQCSHICRFNSVDIPVSSLGNGWYEATLNGTGNHSSGKDIFIEGAYISTLNVPYIYSIEYDGIDSFNPIIDGTLGFGMMQKRNGTNIWDKEISPTMNGNYRFYLSNKSGAGQTYNNVKIRWRYAQIERNTFPTLYEKNIRPDEYLNYHLPPTNLIKTIIMKFNGKLLTGEIGRDRLHFCSWNNTDSSANNYGTVISFADNYLSTVSNDGENYLVITNGKLYINGNECGSVDYRYTDSPTRLFRPIGYISPGYLVYSPRNFVQYFACLERDLTNDELNLYSSNDFYIPEVDSTSVKVSNSKINWKSIRDNYDTTLIPNSSTDLPLKPSKTYIIIDSNGNRYKSKISATGAVTACTGSTNVLSNVSGMIRVTGSVTFPISVEII